MTTASTSKTPGLLTSSSLFFLSSSSYVYNWYVSDTTYLAALVGKLIIVNKHLRRHHLCLSCRRRHRHRRPELTC
jgi:hypothetical protein